MIKRQKALRISNWAWAAKRSLLPVIIVSVLVMTLLAAGTPPLTRVTSAHAMPPEKLASHVQNVTYELYAGGINAVRAELGVAYKSKERYSLELFATTKGFLAKLVPWSGTFETHGWRLKDGKEMPELHKSTALWDGEEDIKEYNYGKDGSFKSLRVVEAGRDESPESLEDELVQGTTDALTATLQAMKAVTDHGTCEGEDEVFDGKRRFKMIFRHQGEEDLLRSDYNIYEGAAVKCEVEVQPITGAWHKKPRGWASIQEQGRSKGSLPTVWLARIDEAAPAIPVKLRVKTDYGTLFMHMVEYRNGDKVLPPPPPAN